MALRLRTSTVALLAAAALAPGCAATLRPPTLQVERLDVERVRVTGAVMDVLFRVRNVNPDPILIESFEYDLVLNGHRLGRGYYAEPVPIDAFGDERVVSRFDLNFLSLPGTVRAILEHDRARARVDGRFYVRRGRSRETLPFSSDAEVDLRR
jgi:LEA14-like dessication related protein